MRAILKSPPKFDAVLALILTLGMNINAITLRQSRSDSLKITMKALRESEFTTGGKPGLHIRQEIDNNEFRIFPKLQHLRFHNACVDIFYPTLSQKARIVGV